MQIPLHGANHDGVFGFDPSLGQQGLQQSHRFLHRTGGNQHLGHKHLVVFELFADGTHAGNEPLFDNFQGLHPGIEKGLGQGFGIVAFAFFNSEGQVGECIHGVD
jgi:hypothetical protein